MKAARVINPTTAALLVGLALVPLAPVFADSRYWLAVAGGLFVGTGVALLSARWRAGALVTIGLSIVGYVTFGGLFALRESAFAGVLPSFATLRDLALNVVFGWKQLLTVGVPVSGFDHLFGMPYLVALVCSTIAVSLAVRSSKPGVPLLPAVAALIVAISFGESEGLVPGVVGGLFAAAGLGWVAWRRSLLRAEGMLTSGEESRRAALRTGALAAAMLLTTGAVGAVAAGAAGATWDRATLREEIIPPLELQDFASPLMSFRKYVADATRQGTGDVLFRVRGLPQGGAIRLASLDLYDGIVYQVSGAGGAGSGVFQRVGRTLPGGDVSGSPATLTVNIESLGGFWVPDAGYLSEVTVAGDRATELRSGLHYNAATGTALQTAGMVAGDQYSFHTTVAARPSDDSIRAASPSKVDVPAPAMSPDTVQAIVTEALPEVVSPGAQVLGVEKYLTDNGYFSDGQGPDAVPSLPGHGYKRLSDMLSKVQLIGDDEQYAVVMALMLAKLGIPARVVMGFIPASATPDTEIAVTGKDVRAWVEVPFDGLGWVSFFPHPKTKPQKETPQTRQRPRPQVPQPPLPPQEPAVLPPQPPDAEAGDNDRGPDLAWLWLTLRVTGTALGGLAIIFGPGLLMLAAQARRRGRRRAADRLPDRLSGGWDEIVDSAADAGTSVATVGTRREQAADLDVRYPDLAVHSLAARADSGVFGAGEPAVSDVAAYWSDVDETRRQIGKRVTLRQRVRRFFAPHSIVSRRPRWWRRT